MLSLNEKLVLVLYSIVLLVNNIKSVVIKTENGLIKGKIGFTVEKNKTFYAFQGIPYAKPPIGSLRFQAPQPADYWNGVLDTDRDAMRCIQTLSKIQTNKNTVGKEDCLYLNVYTPQLPDITKPLLPVMVWIHGGGFNAGTSEYNETGPDYFLDQDVVFVSFNYRLGIFGFLTLGDTIVPGNNGLKDQNLALRWIKQNIINFGGDTDQITLFGQSAGAASISYHLLSPHSEGLFNRVIMQSGTSLCQWAFSRLGPEVAKELATNLNISTKSSEAILSGLRKIDAYYLHTKSEDAMNAKYLKNDAKDGFIFAPVIEQDHPGAFLTGKSHELFRTGKYFKVPTILGYNSLEGWTELSSALRVYLVKYDVSPSNLVPVDMNIYDSKIKDTIGEKIKSEYFGWMPVSLSTNNLLVYIGDDQFIRPIQELTKMISKNSPTYLYKFFYQGGLGGKENRNSEGVAHAEELGYLFRRNMNASDSDVLTRSRMIKLWTNFAKYSNPTPESEPLLQNQKWLPVTSSAILNTFSIDRNLTTIISPDRESMTFWRKLYTRYGNPPYDTY